MTFFDKKYLMKMLSMFVNLFSIHLKYYYLKIKNLYFLK